MTDKTKINSIFRKDFRLLLSLFLTLMSSKSVYAYRFSYDFNNTVLSKALARIGKEHPDMNVSFVYSELDSYRTTAHIRSDNLYDAVRKVVGLNPVSVIEKKGMVFVEALQHGKYHYSGRIIGNDNEPVVAATILLLSPKDSTVITYGISNDTGHFSIPCDRKNVIGKISCLGYKTVCRRFSKFSEGEIIMPEKVITLGQLNVVADDNFLNIDKSVYIPNYSQKNARAGA